MENKVAIITGGGRGIGRAIAMKLSHLGARTVIMARTKSEVFGTAEEINHKGGDCLPIIGDVRNRENVNEAVNTALKKYGTIDILVNNAAISKPASIEKTSEKLWDETLAVNLKGTYLFSRAVIPVMKKNKAGKIINISSIGGRKGFPRYTAYCASKSGVIGFTRALSEEVKDCGIRVNAICPGEVLTRMNKESHPGVEDTSDWLEPEEIAELAVFLALPSSSALQGAVIGAYGNSV